MSVQLNAYLSFKDNARQAMTFYQTVFGGKLEMNTFKEFNSSQDPSEDDLIMHAQLDGDNGVTFMASDTPASMEFKAGTNFSMSLSGDNAEVLTGYFNQLSADGQITMPLGDSPWGDKFGMLTDKFGVAWMVNISKPAAA